MWQIIHRIPILLTDDLLFTSLLICYRKVIIKCLPELQLLIEHRQHSHLIFLWKKTEAALSCRAVMCKSTTDKGDAVVRLLITLSVKLSEVHSAHKLDRTSVVFTTYSWHYNPVGLAQDWPHS